MQAPRRSRRYVVYAPGRFARREARLAHGVLAYGRDEVVAVVDPALAGAAVRDVLPHLRSEAPILASLEAALELRPNALLLGAAPDEPALPSMWRESTLAALRAGLEVVGGLREVVGDDPEFAEAAFYGGVPIRDLGETPYGASSDAADAPRDVVAEPPFTLLTVGGERAVGKTTAALELVRVAAARLRLPEFVATGPVGVAVAGKGVVVDRVPVGRAVAAVAAVVAARDPKSDLVVVEGQGALDEAAGAPLAVAMLRGAAPDGLVLAYRASRAPADDAPRDLIRRLEALAGGAARVLGLAVDTSGSDDAAARETLARLRAATGLPADDLVRFGAEAFYDALAPTLRRGATPAAR